MNPKQQRFCDEYLKNGFNATQAAISAGYSEKTAQEIGSENLSKPIIQAYIAEKKAERSERLSMSTDQWLAKLIGIVDGNIATASFDAGHILKAMELIGKSIGAFEERTRVTIDKLPTPVIKSPTELKKFPSNEDEIDES